MKKIKFALQRRDPSGAGDPTTTSAALNTSEGDLDVQSSPYGFKTWYDPQSIPKGKPHLFDIIFIHGLTGDRERTWTHPESQEPWPKTLIPQEFPGARVLTYGFDAYIMLRKGPVSSNRLNNHSLDFVNALVALRRNDKSRWRPLIFVAHSLGGIVCKDALLLSSRSGETMDKTIFKDTLGVIFMGTPHTGASLAWWAKVPVTALGVVKSTNKNLLDILETSNETLTRIQNEFLQQVKTKMNTQDEIQIACFYETLPMHHFQHIVPADSAILPGFNHISVHADHKNMVKFRSEASDPDCAQFLGILRRWEPQVREKDAIAGLSDDRIERYKKQCIASLAFPDMMFRRSDISDPLQDTCDWIFKEEFYQTWTAEPNARSKDASFDQAAVLDEGVSDLLCIVGKPGSGKSTIMKNLFTVHHQRQVDQLNVCLAFFFNARGSALEKSPEGLYRSLLFQLLRSDLNIFQIVLPVLLEKEAVGLSGPFKWHQSEIAELFHRILRDERVHNVTMFIDGVDECEDNDVGREIVTSLERSLEVSRKLATKLRICLSSRPYRQIKPKFGLELLVETRNTSDIALYVDRELILHDFGDIADLKKKIIEKASGVFLWITLVVSKLRTAWDRGCSPLQIRQILESLPRELKNLYLHITSSMTEEQLKTSSQIAQLVLCSKELLSANDLYSILTLASAPPDVSLLEFVTSCPINRRKVARFEAYVIEVTGGFFEISANDAKHVVQVIHETVRDFLKSSEAQKLYGRTSPAFRERETEEIVLSAMHRYANSKEVRATFAPTEGKHSRAKKWTEFCERNPPQHLYPTSEAASVYLVNNGLDYLTVALQQSHGAQKTSEVQLLLEGWLFAYTMMSLNASSGKGYHGYGERGTLNFVELAQDFLDWISEYKDTLRLTMDEFEQLVICINNRSAFLDTVQCMRKRPKALQQHCSHLFHLACWTMYEDGSSLMGKVHVLNQRARRVAEEGPTVTPHDVIKFCRTNSNGLAFTASFAWSPNSSDLKPVPDTWLIRETWDEFMHTANWKYEDNEEDPTKRMPFHLNAEDGYMVLILAEELGSAAQNQGRSTRPQVFAVIEKNETCAPWKHSGIHLDNIINPVVSPSKQRLRREESMASLQTQAPGRAAGSPYPPIWYAWEKSPSKNKDEADRETIRAKPSWQDGGSELSVHMVKRLPNSSPMDNQMPVSDLPWNPLAIARERRKKRR